MKVLLIEDGQESAQSVKLILQSANISCDIANTGTAALKKLTNHYDIIILDLFLPDMDGMKILAKAKLNHPNTKVLIASGFVDTQQKLTAFHNGADEYLTKPFSAKQLIAKLKMLATKNTSTNDIQ